MKLSKETIVKMVASRAKNRELKLRKKREREARKLMKKRMKQANDLPVVLVNGSSASSAEAQEYAEFMTHAWRVYRSTHNG